MRPLLLKLQMLTMIVASSYVTLGFADPPAARGLWAPYAAVTLVLAGVGLLTEWRNGRR